MACVRRTLSAVPAGSVTGAGALAGSGACAAAGGAFRGVNARVLISSTGNSAIDPLSISRRTILTSALMNAPLTTLPERSVTLSADSVAPAKAIVAVSVENNSECLAMCHLRFRVSFRKRQRRRNLEVEQQQDLVLDLEEACRRFRRER